MGEGGDGVEAEHRAGTFDGMQSAERSVDQVRRVPGVSLEMARQLQQSCDVRSQTFEVTVDAEVGGYKRQFTAILGRPSGGRDVLVLTFYWR
jgi:hypothetical protein